MNTQTIDIESKKKVFYALKYAALGWKVFPLHWVDDDGSCSCKKPSCALNNTGKHPFEKLVPQGQKNATTDTDTIKKWWTEHPKCNIGIFLSASGLIAIDIDPRNGGDYALEELENKYGKLPDDVLQLTGGGGLHYLYQLPSGNFGLPGKLGNGIDVKINGYIVAEPSNHKSGSFYAWEASSSPIDGAIVPPLPDWLRSFSKEQPVTNLPPVQVDDITLEEIKQALLMIPSDDRQTWLEVGMALHHDTGNYSLWCEWSATSDKYNQADQFKTWNSFGRYAGKPKTARTIFKIAYENGWRGQLSDFDEETPKLTDFDLLQYVDDSHILKRMAIEVARAYWLPVNTVFMVGLGVVSSIVMRHYALIYPTNGEKLGAGIYVCAEQKSGGAKSPCLSEFMRPFTSAIVKINDQIKTTINTKKKNLKVASSDEMKAQLEDEIQGLEAKLEYPLFLTSATTEGIEITLPLSNGFFSGISAEKGLLNTLLGKTNGNGSRKNDNDILLRGFDGDYSSGSRVTRKAYKGMVCGSVVTFAQPGSFKTIFDESDGSGLCERFLVLSEQSMVGNINHKDFGKLDMAVVREYGRYCDNLINLVMKEPPSYHDLVGLGFSGSSWDAIMDLKNKLEPSRAEGGKYSGDVASSMCAKIDKQVMKIACSLYFFSNDRFGSDFISDCHVIAAINICEELFDHAVNIMQSAGMDGKELEFKAILDVLENTGSKRRTMRDLKNTLRMKKPFFSIKNGQTLYIGKSIENAIINGIVEFDGKWVYK